MPGFAVIYRWRLKPGMEAQFVEAWTRITDLYIAHRGGLGSRLHKGPDDIWYAYAQWASAAAREAAFAGEPLDTEARIRMREAIAESLEEIVLEPVADRLLGWNPFRQYETQALARFMGQKCPRCRASAWV